MLDLLLDMLRSPEAQADAYTWGAVLLAHFAIGLFLTAVLGWFAGVWRAALIVSVGYLLLWGGVRSWPSSVQGSPTASWTLLRWPAAPSWRQGPGATAGRLWGPLWRCWR